MSWIMFSIQGLVDDGLVNIGKIPGINSSGVANLSNGASSITGFDTGIGSSFFGFSDVSASGGFVIYPNKTNNNYLEAVYAK